MAPPVQNHAQSTAMSPAEAPNIKNGRLHTVVCQHGIMTREIAGHATQYVRTTCLGQTWTSLGMQKMLNVECQVTRCLTIQN